MNDPTPTPPEAEAPSGLGKLVDETPDPAPSATPAGPTPDDAPDEVATGYAVYDETLARYIGGVHKTKKDATAAAKDAPEAHSTKIIRV